MKSLEVNSAPVKINIPETRSFIEAWSPDHEFILLTDFTVIDLENSSLIKPPGFTGEEWGPAFSNDGKYVAYTSDESGAYEVYVRRFPFDEFQLIGFLFLDIVINVQQKTSRAQSEQHMNPQGADYRIHCGVFLYHNNFVIRIQSRVSRPRSQA